MVQVQDFLSWFNNYVRTAAAKNERRMVVLSGCESWAMSLLRSIDVIHAALSTETKQNFQTFSSQVQCLVYGDSAIFPANVQRKRYRDKLGSESDFIIFVDSEFTIDAFAGLSGTLKAGGILFLVIPSRDEKLEQSLFFKRFYSLLSKMPSHTIITESQASVLPLHFDVDNPVKLSATSTYPHGCITQEQYSAVIAIKKVLSGQRKRPLVLTADRGRGKSSALAIACAQLMKEHEQDEFDIVITAPDVQALSVFYRQLKQSLNCVEQQGNTITFGKVKLTFMAVDQLIRSPIKLNLLLVDEAAAIPVYLLEQLLRSYHRMVFSSTVHGYEGAGRGFTLKFKKVLDRLCPQWVNLHINQPIRWRENDPLEQLVFDACLLNAELPKLKTTLAPQPPTYGKGSSVEKAEVLNKSNEPVFKVISAKELVADEALLKQVFAILVTAHYQTKPSDLQLLLDNPQVQLTCLYSSKNNDAEMLAVALLMNEGKGNNVSDADIRAIKHSERRLRNHFLPQSLFSHCGFEQAFNYKYLRIMRIAVHPQIQQQGIGAQFIHYIELLAKEQGVDFIGASFGVNPELLSFWLNAGFSTARIGFTKDKASGEHSALLIKGLVVKSKQEQQSFKRNFYQSFDYLLLEEYRALTTELVFLLLRQNSKGDVSALSERDIANVQAFSRGERLYSSCCYSLYLWLKQDLLSETKCHSTEVLQQSLVLVARLIQKHDSDSVCQQFGLTGKKMLNNHIKNYVHLRLNTAIN
ncbi:GNAT family N-acetyltransferase [Colwellia psychrerythraea]|nr:GNAT family N-acetyltransferase [Colwellia psychrerythraea]